MGLLGKFQKILPMQSLLAMYLIIIRKLLHKQPYNHLNQTWFRKLYQFLKMFIESLLCIYFTW